MTQSTDSLLRAVAVTAVAITVMVGGCVEFVVTHHSSSTESEPTASQEFEHLRDRFVNQQPLLDMDQRQARTEASTRSNAARLHTIHTVIFDTRGGSRTVHVSVRYWWARGFWTVGPGHGNLKWLGQLTFLDDTEFDPEPIRLSWKDMERHGPGLIADYRHRSRGQFMSWAE